MVRNFPGKVPASQQIRRHLRCFRPWDLARVVFGFTPLAGEPDWLGDELPADKLIAYPRMGEDGLLLFLFSSNFEMGTWERENLWAGQLLLSLTSCWFRVWPSTRPARGLVGVRDSTTMACGEPVGAIARHLLHVSDTGESSLRSPRCASGGDFNRGRSPSARGGGNVTRPAAAGSRPSRRLPLNRRRHGAGE